jgi:PAS domain S-box-containing protein
VEENQRIRQNRIMIRQAIIFTLVLTILVGIGVYFIFNQWTKTILVRQDEHTRMDLIKDVQLARKVIDPILHDVRNGALTREQGTFAAQNMLRRMTFTDKYGDNYIFLGLNDGTLLVQPLLPQLENTNQWDLQDVNGIYIFREFIAAIKEHPEGSFIKYTGLNPKTMREEEKISYVFGVPELDGYIGVGVYTSEIYAEEEAFVRQALSITFGTLLLIAIPILMALYRVKKQNDLTTIEILERQKAEKALTASEERLRLALDSSNEGWWDWDIPNDRVYYSPRYFEIIGVSAENFDFTIRGLRNYIHPDDVPLVSSHLTDHMKGKTDSYISEFRVHPLNENFRWIRTTGKIVARDEQNQPIRMVGTIVDITEAKKAAQAIADSEQNLRAIFDNTYDALVIHDHTGKILACNQRTIDLIGLPHNKILHTNVLVTADPDQVWDYGKVKDYWQAVLHGENVIFELRLKNQISQTFTDVEITLRQTRWFGQDAIFAVIRDITQQKLAEQAILASEEKLRTVVEQLYEGLILISEEGKILEWNPVMQDITGILKQEAVGKYVWDFNLGSLRDQEKSAEEKGIIASLFHEVKKSQDSPFFNNPVDIRLPASGGRERIVQQILFPVVTEKEFRIGATFVDVTEQRQAQERIRLEFEKIKGLRQIDSSIAAHPDINSTIEVIFNQVRNLLHVDAACLMLMNDNEQSLNNAFSYGINKQYSTCPVFSLQNSNSARTIRELQPLWFHYDNRPEDSILCRCADQHNFKTYAAAPLIVNGIPIGVFEVFLKEKFTPPQEWMDYFVTLAGQTSIAIDSFKLYHDLQQSNHALLQSYESTIQGWAKALELKDKETKGHSDRVMALACKLATRMGFTPEQLKHFRNGVYLHDIGKMGIPDAILLKPGPLTDEEWEIMRQHPVYAYNLLRGIEYLEPALEIPYSHHERWDGSGYPQGLKGKTIPLGARIFAVVDVWDALTSDRPYRAALSVEETSQYLLDNAGKLFDPQVVQQLLDMMKDTQDEPVLSENSQVE